MHGVHLHNTTVLDDQPTPFLDLDDRADRLPPAELALGIDVAAQPPNLHPSPSRRDCSTLRTTGIELPRRGQVIATHRRRRSDGVAGSYYPTITVALTASAT